jgi:hypothetical protein
LQGAKILLILRVELNKVTDGSIQGFSYNHPLYILPGPVNFLFKFIDEFGVESEGHLGRMENLFLALH